MHVFIQIKHTIFYTFSDLVFFTQITFAVYPQWSLGEQDQTVNPKGNQPWIFIDRTDAEAETPILWPPREELTHLKRPWCWERLKVGGEGDDRRWDGWMASPTQRTWVWVNSGSWWWTGRPGILQSMGSQRVRHNQVTELNWLTALELRVRNLSWSSWAERGKEVILRGKSE